MLVRWNERAMPQMGDAVRWRSRDVAPVEDDPARGRRSCPVSRLKNVVLPAPLGPMTECSEPSSTAIRDVVDAVERAEGLRQAARF
jgi:hypothetical protein